MSEDCLLQIATYFSDKLRAARQDQVQDGKILLTISLFFLMNIVVIKKLIT